MTDWDAITERVMQGITMADPIYRPTNFWGPGVRRLIDDMEKRGLDTFKSWPTAASWFYPTYGIGFTHAMIESMFHEAASLNPTVDKSWFTAALTGVHQARRDLDAVRLAWDQARWPFDIEGLGESDIGKPPQRFRLMGSNGAAWTRPYLNYLLSLAALSRHVEAPPRRFLEIGGGYGVLGEIVMSRDPEACYIDLDLPPLTTVASFYLRALFGDRVSIFDDTIADSGPIEVVGSACLPNWRIDDVAGPFDVFFNSFSFQEMEPDVVARYVEQVAAKRVSHVVSLNSILGKARAADGDEGGVIDPVTSEQIVAMFQACGYELLERHGDPLIQSAGEIAILRRTGLTARPTRALGARPTIATVDHRAKQITPRPSPGTPGRSSSRRGRFARDWLPPKLLRAARKVRARLR
jgi:putative sugar O-methyltransferase